MSKAISIEQAKALKDALNDNFDDAVMAAAKEKTNNIEYTELEEATIADITPQGSFDTLEEPSEAQYFEAFEAYGVEEKEAIDLLKIIEEYKKTRKVDLEVELPKSIKSMIRGFMITADSEGHHMTKKQATRFMLDTLINDTNIGQAIDEYHRQVSDVLSGADKEISAYITDEIDGMINRIDEIETDDPALAERLRNVKQVFADTAEFKEQLEYVEHCNIKKLNKKLDRFEGECFYFNKKVNTTDIKIPPIEELPEIIDFHTNAEYSQDAIRRFVLVLINTTTNKTLNLDDENYINVWYVYKLIEQIYSLKFAIGTDIHQQDRYKDLIGNMSKVLDKLQ